MAECRKAITRIRCHRFDRTVPVANTYHLSHVSRNDLLELKGISLFDVLNAHNKITNVLGF